MANTIFITALDARQNPIRERVVFDEGTAISSAILDSVRSGFFNTVVDGGSPMTQTAGTISNVVSTDTATYSLQIPSHTYNTGDAVYVTSTGILPGPLEKATLYYIIYVDADHVRLALTKADALSRRPMNIDFVSGVNNINLSDQGTGYTVNPTVVISGGGATVDATAVAYLAPYGDISYINVQSKGAGYHYVPSVVIEAQGTDATASSVYLKVVSATVNSGGINYHVGDLLSLTASADVAATAAVTSVDVSGAVTSVSLVNGGSYASVPSLISSDTSVVPGGGTGCTLDLVLGVGSIEVGLGGSQYTEPPLVKIISNSGTGAVATSYLAAGSVTAIVVTTPGSGYTSLPTIVISSGTGAAATAYLVPTKIGSIVLTSDGGDTYTYPPDVTIQAAGSGATVGTVTMQINTATLTTGGGGSQYVIGDILVLAGGQGSASATVRINTVDDLGSIVSYTLLTSGSYTELPIMTGNAAYGGSGRGASFDLRAGVYSIEVDLGGQDYTAPPNVFIHAVDGTGNGAAAYAVLTADSVTNIVMTASGTGYTQVPDVYMDNGSGAAAHAVLVSTTVDVVNVTDGGYGYTYANVVFTGGGGTGAVATAVIVGGAVDHIAVTSQGYGYTTPPNVEIVGDGHNGYAESVLTATSVYSVVLTDQGSNYTTIPNVIIDGAATATASLYSTGVQQIVVTAPGQDYTSTPVVSVMADMNETGTPTPPTTTVVRGFSLSSILVTSQGEGYTSDPTVNISAPDQLFGNAAVATATIGYGSGTMSIVPYPASRDYWLVSQGFSAIDPNMTRPYNEHISTVINYFTNLGYTITAQTNPATGNTLRWVVNW
jgi:hypothetical protein